jgi:hypothetical protein
VYPPWKAFGLRHLTDKIARERADAYLSSVMARM